MLADYHYYIIELMETEYTDPETGYVAADGLADTLMGGIDNPEDEEFTFDDVVEYIRGIKDGTIEY